MPVCACAPYRDKHPHLVHMGVSLCLCALVPHALRSYREEHTHLVHKDARQVLHNSWQAAGLLHPSLWHS